MELKKVGGIYGIYSVRSCMLTLDYYIDGTVGMFPLLVSLVPSLESLHLEP